MIKFGYHILQIIVNVLFHFNNSKNETLNIIEQLESTHQGKFTKEAIQKASRFQAIQQILINDAFANLINRKTNEVERTSNKLYFILAGLYDDIIDKKILSTVALDTLFINPLDKIDLFETKALVDLHLQLLNRTKDPIQYKSTLAKIHQAQKDSLKQFNCSISQEEILEITLRKGGYSLLMCRQYIDLPNSEQMDECWYQLGGIIQFTNDLYDIFKDVQEGIHTYPNRSTNLNDLKNCHEQLINTWKTTINSLPFSKSHKDKLLIQLSIIPAFGYIALDNLSKLQNNQGNLPNFSEVNRKDLIVDMEKTKNRFKLIQYAYNIVNSN